MEGQQGNGCCIFYEACKKETQRRRGDSSERNLTDLFICMKSKSHNQHPQTCDFACCLMGGDNEHGAMTSIQHCGFCTI